MYILLEYTTFACRKRERARGQMQRAAKWIKNKTIATQTTDRLTLFVILVFFSCHRRLAFSFSFELLIPFVTRFNKLALTGHGKPRHKLRRSLWCSAMSWKQEECLIEWKIYRNIHLHWFRYAYLMMLFEKAIRNAIYFRYFFSANKKIKFLLAPWPLINDGWLRFYFIF